MTEPKTQDDNVVLLRAITQILEKIEKNQASPGFNAGSAAAAAIAGAFSFILGLALNSFFVQVFAKIPVGGGLLGAAIYAIVALIVCITALFLIYSYLEPFLRKKFARH